MGTAVTRFEGIVEARSLGTADVDKMAAAIDKQSNALLQLGKNVEQVKKQDFGDFAQRVREGMQDPLNAVGSAAEDLLKRLGPVGTGIAGTAGILAGFTVAGFAAAKALGEYGDQVEAVKLRTGLAAKEVGQFSFATKAVGQDISVVEHMMRGLTEAVTDQTEKGADARGWLRHFGVDLNGVRTGSVDTKVVLMQLAEGLEKLPTVWQRNQAAMEIFKRVGIEAIPVLLQLRENIHFAEAEGFGPDEATLARFNQLDREVAAIDTKWQSLKRQFQEGLVIEVKFAGRAAEWLLRHLPGETVQEEKPEAVALANDIAMARQASAKGWGTTYTNPIAWLYQKRMQALAHLSPMDAFNAPTAGSEADKWLRIAQDSLEKIQRLQKQADDERAAADKRKRDTDAAQESRTRVHIQMLNEQRTVQREVNKEVDAFGKQMLAKDLDPVTRIFQQRDELVKKGGGWSTTTLYAIVGATRELNKQYDELQPKMWRTWTEGDKLESHAWDDVYKNLGEASRRTLKQATDLMEQSNKTDLEIAALVRGSGRQDVMRDFRKRERLDQLELGPGQEGAAIGRAYQEQLGLAVQLYRIDVAWANQQTDAQQRRLLMVHAEADLRQAMGDAEMERELKLAELQRQRIDALRAFTVEGFHSLLQGPQGIEGFLKNQMMRFADQVVGNAAEMGWKSVQGKIPHASADSIWGKLLGGTIIGPDPLKVATDANTIATAANTAALRALATSASGGGGGAVSGAFSPANWSSLWPSSGAGPDQFSPAEIASLAGPTVGPNAGGGFSAASATPMASPSSWAKYAGAGAALAAGGFGIYSGVRQGGASGALTAAGSTLAMAGTLLPMLSKGLSMAGPIGLIAGLGLSLVPMLFPNHKQERANEEQQTLLNARYTPPTATAYTVDRYGRGVDTDVAGNVRPIIQVNIPLQMLDAQSFSERGARVVADAVSTAIESNLSTRLATNLKAAAGVPR